MPDYYCWYEYYWGNPVDKNIKGDELRYYHGHKHGVRPTQQQWATCATSLYANVDVVAKEKDQTYPGNAAVLQAATQKTRSAH